MRLQVLFTEHPATVGETYFRHLLTAGAFALRLLWISLACLVHAVLPFLFVHTGSDGISRLHQQMTERRRPLSHSNLTRNVTARD